MMAGTPSQCPDPPLISMLVGVEIAEDETSSMLEHVVASTG
jgi:hypothetical protein